MGVRWPKLKGRVAAAAEGKGGSETSLIFRTRIDAQTSAGRMAASESARPESS